MQVIKKGEIAEQTGVLLNKGEHQAYTEYLKMLPDFFRYLEQREYRSLDNWD